MNSLKHWIKSKKTNDFFKTFREKLRINSNLNELKLFFATFLNRKKFLYNHDNCLRFTNYSMLKKIHILLFENVFFEMSKMIEKLNQAFFMKLQQNIIENESFVLWKSETISMFMFWNFFERKFWTINSIDWILTKYWKIRIRKCFLHVLTYVKVKSKQKKFVQKIAHFENVKIDLLIYATTKTKIELTSFKKEQTEL